MSNIFAGHANSYHGFDFEQTLDGISKAGFKYIELAAVQNWTEHVMSYMSDDELAEKKKLMEKYGISAIGMSGHCNLFDEERLEDFKKNIVLAKKMGCKYIVTSTGEAHFGTEVVNDDLLIENIKKVVPTLEENDIQMVLELHGLYATGKDMLKIVKGVGSDYVRIAYDTANIVHYADVLPTDDIKCCVDYVKYVHLKDKIGGKGVWNFPGTGNGELPLKEFMEYMDEHGYDGPYSIEIEFTEDFCMRDKDQPGDIDKANKEMADSYKYLKSLGRVE